LFAGVSLDGAVVAAREGDNDRYYGSDASTISIVFDRRFDHAGAAVLRQALSPQP
jgi:lipid-binding SYLF domain-containing protein